MKKLLFLLPALLLSFVAHAEGENSQSPVYTVVLTAIISAGTSYLVSVFVKRHEYKNEYYKKVIDKRLAVYEVLEKQLMQMRPTLTDRADGKVYLAIFSLPLVDFRVAVDGQLKALSQGLWLSSSVYSQLIEVNKAIARIYNEYDTKRPDQLVKAGKDFNEFLCGARDNLEVRLKNDMRHLHDVDRFFDRRA